MSEPATSVGLDGVSASGSVRFIRAEWWDNASRFAVVVANGPFGEKRLRMDINKQAFLDYFGDEKLDNFVRASALSIWEVIARARLPR